MMENQGENSVVIGKLFNADPSSQLSFASNVDLPALTFSFSLDPGSTYEGLPIALTGSGAFDASTGLWDASSSGTLGSASWTVSGTYSVSGDVRLEVSNIDVFFPFKPFKIFDLHDVVVYDTKTGESGGTFHFTDAKGNRPPCNDLIKAGCNWYLNDTLGKDGKWTWTTTTDTFRVDSSGDSPATGGTGSFSARISPIPEPHDLLLVGTVMLGLYRARCWRCRRNGEAE